MAGLLSPRMSELALRGLGGLATLGPVGWPVARDGRTLVIASLAMVHRWIR